MASFPLSAIGAAASGAERALSGAGRAVHSLGKGLEFAGQLGQTALLALENGDAIAQVASALTAGTPMAAIANNVATNLSSALVKAAGNRGNTNAQSALQRAMASALAPPGTSPPGNSGTEQAAVLQQQLTSLVTRLAGETNSAGQQSEFSGTVLDADTARETPAQQMKSTNGTALQTEPDAVASFVQTLLSAAVSSATAPSGALGTASSAAPGKVAQIQPQQPGQPDILSRMLARAANADAQRNNETVARGVPVGNATNATQHVSTSNGNANAALFDRLIAIMAEEQPGSHSGTDGKGQSQDFQQPGQGQTQNVNSTTASFAAQAANAPVSNSQVQNQSGSATLGSMVDPNAVIEQLVKGITMRNSGSTSEVQLRLQPEHLGNVSLKLTVSGNTISASVVAQNADVRDMLLSNQQHLVRSLAEAGLSLGKFSVDVSGGNTGFTQHQSQQQGALGRAISAGGSLLSGEDATWEDQRFGPSLTSGPASLVFNYLA